jgi:hypothetical protein
MANFSLASLFAMCERPPITTEDTMTLHDMPPMTRALANQERLRQLAQDAASDALFTARQTPDAFRVLCEALMAEAGNSEVNKIITALLAIWNATPVDGDDCPHFDGMRRLADVAEGIADDYELEAYAYRLRPGIRVHPRAATFVRAGASTPCETTASLRTMQPLLDGLLK